MKRLIILSIASLMIAGTVNAQMISKVSKREDKKELRKLKGNAVSSQSKSEFKTDFGKVTNVQWKRTSNFDEATFKKGNSNMTAYYDEKGMLVGTMQPKNFTDLPAKAQKYINEKYKGYNKSNVVFFDDNEKNETDMVFYDQQFNDVDSYFVELKNDKKDLVLEVTKNGEVSYFRDLK